MSRSLYFPANKHFYDNRKHSSIESIAPGTAEAHIVCRAIEPCCIYWLKIYNLLLMSFSNFLYCENILWSSIYVQSTVYAFVCALCVCTPIDKYNPRMRVICLGRTMPVWVLTQNWECISWCWLMPWWNKPPERFSFCRNKYTNGLKNYSHL